MGVVTILHFFCFFLTPPLERVEGKCNAQKVLTMASVIMFLNYSFIPSCSVSEICHHYIWYSVLVCINNTIWWVSYRSGRGDQENRNKKGIISKNIIHIKRCITNQRNPIITRYRKSTYKEKVAVSWIQFFNLTLLHGSL